MHDGTEHVGFRAIHRRIFVNERDQAARPSTKIITFMQINPAFVRRNLLNNTRVDSALGPSEIDPFHAAQCGDQFFPRALNQLGEIFAIFAICRSLLGIIVFFTGNSIFLKESRKICCLIISKPLRLFCQHIFGFLTWSKFNCMRHDSLIKEFEILN